LLHQQYVEYKLDKDFTREAFIGQFGEESTFPQVSVDATTIGGCSETVKYLQQHQLV
jgi:glutaredoxin 3